MASKKRTGLGRGLSALIPTTPIGEDRDVDVFFDGSAPTGRQHAQGHTATPEYADGLSTDETGSEAGSAVPATAKSDGRKQSAVEGNASSTAKLGTSAEPESKSEDLLPVPGARLQTLKPESIVPNARQPRHEFNQDDLAELIVSVREYGVLQPLVVRPLSATDPRSGEGEYELIMGERRLRASKAAGLTEIPVIVRDTDDDDMLRDALLENLHRADLNPLEEASAYRQLLDDFGCTQEELAARIGRSRPRIANTLRLLNLPVEVQRRVAAGVLSAGHARAVLSVGDPELMVQLADRIVNEELSVREAEAVAGKLVSRAGTARQTRRDAPRNELLTAHLNEVGQHLGDRLNTRVKVVLRKTKGSITIDFASVTDLNRILSELGVAENTENEDAAVASSE